MSKSKSTEGGRKLNPREVNVKILRMSLTFKDKLDLIPDDSLEYKNLRLTLSQYIHKLIGE